MSSHIHTVHRKFLDNLLAVLVGVGHGTSGNG